MNFEFLLCWINIIQGEFKVFNDLNVVIMMIFGLCVVVCICDFFVGVGGMNYFFLLGSMEVLVVGGDVICYGVYFMEFLINGLLKQGVCKDCMEVKIFGGVKIIVSFFNVGVQNVEFVVCFFCDEGISVVGLLMGGEYGCKLEFWLVLGRVCQYVLMGVEMQCIVVMEICLVVLVLKLVVDILVEFF